MYEMLSWFFSKPINFVAKFSPFSIVQPTSFINTNSIQSLDFQAIFEAMPGNSLILDTKFNIIKVNEAYLKATNTDRTIIGRDIRDVFAVNPANFHSKGENNLSISLQRVVNSRKKDTMAIQKCDIPLPDRGGFEEHYWRRINTPVLNKKGEVIYIICQIEEVTPSLAGNDKVASQEKNRGTPSNSQELRRAKETVQSQTIFFNNVSHEFRTPLTLILGHIEDLLKKNTLSDVQVESLESAHNNAVRLLKLVTALLDFSKLEANHLEPRYEPVNLAQITKELAGVFKSESVKNRLLYRVDISPLSQEVYIDRDMWEKIILNLLSNAFKYAKKGSIIIKLRENNNCAELSVSDTGMGISPEDLPHIFERFYTGENAKGGSIEGLGIGLSLVKEMVELHKSKIQVESVLEEGTTFTVTIPFGTAHLPQEKIRPKNNNYQSNRITSAYVKEISQLISPRGLPDKILSTSDKPCVLIVDDNQEMRQLISNYLSSSFQILFAENGEVALKKARTLKPDLILTDIDMPKMNGFELLEAIRKDEKLQKIPVIMLSAHAGEEIVVKGLEAEANDYLTRPFSAKVLIARINTQLKLKNLQEQVDRDKRNKFIDSVCHEVRNPLDVINGNVELLREKLIHLLNLIENNNLNQETRLILADIQELVADIITSAESQKNIIDKVLKLSKLENNPDELEISYFNPKNLIRDIIQVFKLKTNKKNIFLKLELPIDDIEIASDLTRLKDILMHLLANAIKFTSQGGVTVKLNYPKIANTDQSMMLNFTVEDTGSGMDAEEINLLFHPYSQSSKNSGFGLGLPICKQMIISLGGEVGVESKKEQGSQFHFTVRAQARALSPLHSPPIIQEEIVEAKDKQKSPPSFPKIPLNILIVDDNELNRKTLIMRLKQAEYKFENASNGLEAISHFKEKKFDIIFMDMKMPGMNGIETTKKMRELEKKEGKLVPTVIIGISADNPETYGKPDIEKFLDDYLIKPSSKEILIEKLNQVAYKKSLNLNLATSSSSFWGDVPPDTAMVSDVSDTSKLVL
jgi:signal transduction histidine kinase